MKLLILSPLFLSVAWGQPAPAPHPRPAVDIRMEFPVYAQVVIDKEEMKRKISEDVRRAVEGGKRAAEDARRLMSEYRYPHEDTYQAGTRALDRRDYNRAVASFDKVIASKSTRAEGAYYWKAYALNKLGKREEALAALSELGKQYPQSRWLNDANALAAEVKQANGQGLSPEAQGDEDLKLYAINALANSDPDRAVPLLQKLLAEVKTAPRLKERALFVLAQSPNESARATVRQYARQGSNPDLQLHAVEYLGAVRSKESQQTLAEVYQGATDMSLKRAVLRGQLISRDVEHLAAVAKSETQAELRREAILSLGSLQAGNELAQLYAAESNFEWKDRILRAMSRSHSTAKLLEVARTDKDSRLRLTAVRSLGSARKELSADDLAALYAAEPEVSVRRGILDALFSQGYVKHIVDAARKESDPELKQRAVERLSRMKSKEAADFLVELLNK